MAMPEIIMKITSADYLSYSASLESMYEDNHAIGSDFYRAASMKSIMDMIYRLKRCEPKPIVHYRNRRHAVIFSEDAFMMHLPFQDEEVPLVEALAQRLFPDLTLTPEERIAKLFKRSFSIHGVSPLPAIRSMEDIVSGHLRLTFFPKYASYFSTAVLDEEIGAWMPYPPVPAYA